MLRRIHLRTRAGGSRRAAAGLALLVAVGVIVAIVLVTQSSTSPGSAGASTQASGATTVQRRDLVATDTESGTLSYANPQTVYDRLSGTITWLPSVGQVINQGQALFRVDGKPVVLMNGRTPAYRDLNASDTPGNDILELNRDLIALGYTSEGIIADDEWQAATTAAVELFQESVGESPTGSLALGQVVFLPGSQVVSTVDGTLGSGGGGGGGGGGSPAADLRLGTPAPEFVSLTTETTSSQAPTSPSQPSDHNGHHGHRTGSSASTVAALIALLRAESAQLRAEMAQLAAAAHGSGNPKNGSGGSPSGNSGSGSPSRNSGSGGSGGGGSGGGGGGSGGGGGGGTATAVLQTSSTRLVATVDLDPSKQSEAKVGEKVTVQMPAGNTVNGTVSAVSPVAQSSSGSGNSGGGSGGGGSGNGNGNGNGNGSGSSTTIPVTITLSGHQSGAGLDQAAVSVNFVQSEANNVLSVPVTALLATAGGGYAVQEAVAPHKLVPVTTGLFAAGYVQISGPGIYSGLQVTDSQG